MIVINVKLPDSILKQARELAARDGVSLDQFVSTAVAEKSSAWLSKDYVAERARRASREKSIAALAQVPDAPLPAGDER
jgi:hypothetical protein